MFLLLLFLLPGSLVLLPCKAAAGGDEAMDDIYRMSLEELLQVEVSVASSRKTDVFHSISTVSVIDGDTIGRYGFSSIAEALRILAGVDVSRTYLKRSLPTVRGILQNHYANKVLVMIEGVPTWNAVTGEANLERIDIADVERIEVLKGPASVKYGTNSFAGAINIVLKRTERGDRVFHTTVGDNGVLVTGLRLGFGQASSQDEHEEIDGRAGAAESETASSEPVRNGRLESSLYLNYSGCDGYDYRFLDETGIDGTVKDFIENRNATWKMDDGRQRLLVNVFRGEEGYLGVIPRYSRGAGIGHELEGRLFDYSVRHAAGPDGHLTFHVSHDWNRRVLARNATDRSEIAGYRIATSLVYDKTLNSRSNWQAGVDYEHRKSQSYRNYVALSGATLDENNLDDKHLWEKSVFSSLQWMSGCFNLSAGLRWTSNALFGRDLSCHFTAVRPLGELRSWKFIYAQSFRAPSLFELNFETGSGTVFGNPELEPEQATSFELAYLWKHRNLFCQATAYHTDYENKILRALRSGVGPLGTVFTNRPQYVNGGDFYANGLELELRYENPRRGGLQGFLNLGLLDGDDGDRVVEGVDTGIYNFLSVPVLSLSLGLQKGLGKRGSFSTVVNHWGDTKDTEGNRIGSVTTVDVNFRLKNRSGTGHYDLSVKNLFDHEVLLPEYSRPGSSIVGVPGLGNDRWLSLSYSVRF